MVFETLRERLRPSRASGVVGSGGPPATHVQVVGRDATVADGLRRAGLTVVDHLAGPGGDGRTDGQPRHVAVVLDPEVRPAQLPRQPLRIGVVARGDAPRWVAAGFALEDLDAVAVTTAEDADLVGPHAVARPTMGTTGADGVVGALADVHARPRLHVVTGVSNLNVRHRWGDHHFAVATAKAASRAGWVPRTWCQTELPEVDHRVADLGLLLAGKVDLVPLSGVPTLAWVISHPDRLERPAPATGADGLGGLAHVHVASPTVAADLVAAGVSASTLLQATDPARFHPTSGGPAHELLFVANSRGVRRRILDDLLPTDHELAVYGSGWTPDLLDPRHLVADHLPNATLPAAYSAAGVVLSDHWDDMRTRGLLSNRLFDAAACGATIVSDEVVAIDEVFRGGVTTYRTPGDLRRTVDDLLADPGRRRELGERAREAVVDGHSFDHRIATLLASAPPLARSGG